MGTITSANVTVYLTLPDVFTSPQLIEGFAADDAFTQEAADLAETRMGVDAKLSGGYTPSVKRWTVALQPDSPSLPVFYTWKAAIEAALDQFPDGSGITITMPSIGSAFDLNRLFFKNSSMMPSAKKLLEPFLAIIEYQDLGVSPI
jgi:hypothetical protein